MHIFLKVRDFRNFSANDWNQSESNILLPPSLKQQQISSTSPLNAEKMRKTGDLIESNRSIQL